MEKNKPWFFKIEAYKTEMYFTITVVQNKTKISNEFNIPIDENINIVFYQKNFYTYC